MPTKSIMLTDVAEGVWSETVELRETAGLRSSPSTPQMGTGTKPDTTAQSALHTSRR